MSEKERKELNLKAGRLIDSLGISIPVTENLFDVLREEFDHVGYASYYLKKCWNKSKLKNEANVAVYKRLLEIDSKLGLAQSEQLFQCLLYSPQKDLIEVELIFDF